MNTKRLIANNQFMIDRWGIRPYGIFLCENIKGAIKLSNPHLEIKKWTLGIQEGNDHLRTMLIIKGKTLTEQQEPNPTQWKHFYHTILPILHEIAIGEVYFVEENGELTPVKVLTRLVTSK